MPLLSRNLVLRFLSSVVLIPTVVASVWVGDLPYVALVTFFMAGAMWEWSRLHYTPRTRAVMHVTWMMTALVFLPVSGAITLLAAGFFALLEVINTLAIRAIRTRILLDKEQLAHSQIHILLTTLFGFALILGAGASLITLRAAPDGFSLILFICVVVWGTDTAAYATGRLIGGAKLAPTISPNKTWSGSIGGAVAGTLAGLAVAYGFRWGWVGDPAADCAIQGACLTYVPLKLLGYGGMALFLSIVSQAGDLFESALKRRAGVKDSGTIIPGHGGVLDRLDGLLAASLAFGLVHHGAVIVGLL